MFSFYSACLCHRGVSLPDIALLIGCCCMNRLMMDTGSSLLYWSCLSFKQLLCGLRFSHHSFLSSHWQPNFTLCLWLVLGRREFLSPSRSWSLLSISAESWFQDFLCHFRDGWVLLLLLPHKQWLRVCCSSFSTLRLLFHKRKEFTGCVSPAATDGPLKGALSSFLSCSQSFLWVWVPSGYS